MQQGTILFTLNEGSQSGLQPAHMELAAIIIGLAIRRWKLPPQQGDTIYSDCNPSRISSKAQLLHYLNTQPSYHSFKRSYITSKPSAPRESPLTGPNPIQNDGSRRSNTRSKDWGILLADCAASNYPIPSQIRIQQHIQLSLPTLL